MTIKELNNQVEVIDQIKKLIDINVKVADEYLKYRVGAITWDIFIHRAVKLYQKGPISNEVKHFVEWLCDGKDNPLYGSNSVIENLLDIDNIIVNWDGEIEDEDYEEIISYLNTKSVCFNYALYLYY